MKHQAKANPEQNFPIYDFKRSPIISYKLHHKRSNCRVQPSNYILKEQRHQKQETHNKQVPDSTCT